MDARRSWRQLSRIVMFACPEPNICSQKCGNGREGASASTRMISGEDWAHPDPDATETDESTTSHVRLLWRSPRSRGFEEVDLLATGYCDRGPHQGGRNPVRHEVDPSIARGDVRAPGMLARDARARRVIVLEA